MRLGITTFGCDAGRSGIGRYALSMLDAILELPVEMELCVWCAKAETDLWFRSDSRLKLIAVHDRWSRSAPSVIWHQWALPHEVRREKLDAIWLPAANRRLPWRLPCPTLGTVHDLGSLNVRAKYSRFHDLYVRHLLPRMIRHLDSIITISDFSKSDIVKFTGAEPEKIAVIPLGVNHQQFCVAELATAREKVASVTGGQPYLIYVSRLEHPAKNHVGLIEAFERLMSEHDLPHQLLLVGPDWNRAHLIHERIAQSTMASRIKILGFAPQELLPSLYQAADLCVIPSLHEGFGLPVIEAMACGVPVAIADCTSLPEVAGDVALKFDPNRCGSMAEVIYQGLTDQAWRAQAIPTGIARAAMFHWKTTAIETLKQIALACGAPLDFVQHAEVLRQIQQLSSELHKSVHREPDSHASGTSAQATCLETQQ